MPSKTKAQHNLMEAAAHGSDLAVKKVQSAVAKEFVQADKYKDMFRKKAKVKSF